MTLIRLAALAAAGALGYRYFDKLRRGQHAAFADGQGDGENFAQVRDSGPSAMADKPRREWTGVDEESDQSFPASDPPANY
ncbi:hypothetical protein D2V17_12905 [Aurantiacibacter xanthus]|uniref:Uncharacterized protein n=1 Tax=Aurantiacibacter xanthus TaxID=1784712 RepID=A0A3A1P3S1_9SPHN|nr:hypothetical protein [Aurantiacibacter xanthus]RIV83487.1 hypothetical protein D2V17_12905 [Aurantiacibacter xanthus]